MVLPAHLAAILLAWGPAYGLPKGGVWTALGFFLTAPLCLLSPD
jgi:hypothetical protein